MEGENLGKKKGGGEWKKRYGGGGGELTSVRLKNEK